MVPDYSLYLPLPGEAEKVTGIEKFLSDFHFDRGFPRSSPVAAPPPTALPALYKICHLSFADQTVQRSQNSGKSFTFPEFESLLIFYLFPPSAGKFHPPVRRDPVVMAQIQRFLQNPVNLNPIFALDRFSIPFTHPPIQDHLIRLTSSSGTP